MRLDKFLTNNTNLSRSESVKAIKAGRVKIEGLNKVLQDTKIDESSAVVFLDGQQVAYQKFVYLMLNKPLGVVSATNDTQHKTVLDLVPEQYSKHGLFPVGRLDKDTLGLVILTNNGQGAHKVLSPKNHVKKVYKYECADPLCEQDKQKIELGITLKDGYTTKPCKIKITTEKSGEITLTEGKYHEIKRLFGSVGNKITYLERICFGGITLDPKLNRGEFRPLNQQEIKIFE
ncbi:MAG: 16S rRNA pseudouridine(516) synthase [Clostridiales bacterium]|nr:16S rRNA pseudouridine(516) synthase [Clostridiales bacterium]